MRTTPASVAQQRFFLLDQMEANAARTLVKRIEVPQGIDLGRLLAAIRGVLWDNPCLRASLTAIDGTLVLREHDVEDVPLESIASERTGDRERDGLIERLRRPFEHGGAPLCRILVLHEEEATVVYWVVHHAIFDDVSTPLLLDGLVRHYDGDGALRAGEVPPPHDDGDGRLRAYWRDALRDLHGATSTPAPAAPRGSRRLSLERPLDPALSEAVMQAVRTRGVTAFSQFAAATGAVLSWCLGRDEIVLMTASQPLWRTPAHGIGCHQNTLPIRLNVTGHSSFSTFADHVRDRVLDAYEHGALPIEDIAAQADAALKTAHASKPLSDIVIVTAERSRSVESNGRCWTLSEMLPLDTEYPLTLTLVNADARPDGVRAEWPAGQFTQETISVLLKHVHDALDKVASGTREAPDATIFLDADDRNELQQLCTARVGAEPANTPVAVITEAARQHPTVVAITVGGAHLTYGDMTRRMRRIAGSLRAHGIGRGDRVAVALPRDASLIPVLLGILWAGAAFVPIDPEHPGARIDAILNDAQPALLVATALRRPGVTTLDPAELDRGDRDEDGPCPAQADDPMYILYTSGTTGEPKGVLIENRSVAAFVDAADERLSATAAHVIAGASLTFDASILDLFWPLMTGRQIVLTDHKRLLSASLPEGAVYQCTPTIARTLVATLPGQRFLATLEMLILSGEKVPSDLVEGIAPITKAALWNGYGPTETTVMSHLGRIEDPDRPVIGWPLAGASCHLVDPRGRPVPPGWPGRVVVGGTGLARAYWRRDALTRERFRAFAHLGLTRGYDAGDMAILDRSTGFQVVGRTDNQIKIMGQRVETEEIEHCIRKVVWVADAAVTVAGPLILAWLCKNTGPSDAAASLSSDEEVEIRRHLLRHLPSIMVPNRFLCVGALPQLPSGKLDRRALLDWAETAAVEPAPPQEADSTLLRVANIWSRVLGMPIHPDTCDPRQTFFQLGGTSAGLIRAFDQLARHHPDLALADLFDHTTLPGLAAFLDRPSEDRPGGRSEEPSDDREFRGRGRLQAVARLARHRHIRELSHD